VASQTAIEVSEGRLTSQYTFCQVLAVVETHHGHGPGQRLPLQYIGNVALALRLLRIPVCDFELVKGVHCRQHMLEGSWFLLLNHYIAGAIMTYKCLNRISYQLIRDD
jgi:hypothetical protein